MKLYADPISTTSRAVLLYLAEHPSNTEVVVVELMKGGHQTPEYAAINPNKAVPTLVDGDFVLTEASAILKYLADVDGSPAYPKDLKARARVNQAMDWLNTGFYKDFGYGVVYSQTLPDFIHANPTTHAECLARGRQGAARWLSVLNDHWLTDGGYMCGKELTIADYLGAAYVSVGDWVGFDISAYPNIVKWQAAMRGRPSWDETNGAWNGVTQYFRSQVAQPA